MDTAAGHDHADLKKHVRIYLIVFGSLMVLTLVTVGVRYLDLPVLPASRTDCADPCPPAVGRVSRKELSLTGEDSLPPARRR